MLRDMMMLMKKAPPVVLTYATWNPADKHSTITLSNGNLTATKPDATIFCNVRSTLSKSAGKWYWEVTAGTGSISIGVCNSGHETTGGIGSVPIGAGYSSSGTVSVNTGVSGSLGSYTTGYVIGVALNAAAGQVTFYKNGVSIGTFTQGVNSYFAGLSLSESSATANFGASPFVYTVPSGYNAGLYV